MPLKLDWKLGMVKSIEDFLNVEGPLSQFHDQDNAAAVGGSLQPLPDRTKQIKKEYHKLLTAEEVEVKIKICEVARDSVLWDVIVLRTKVLVSIHCRAALPPLFLDSEVARSTPSQKCSNLSSSLPLTRAYSR
ncbi:hypothetical protein DL96DRAFT_1822942 [Flagelloscypha sp. PMI_526]|nr:hypothetical protein DL96DRAFT_1822942 [Flagelloscypha sp. PMI_526]